MPATGFAFGHGADQVRFKLRSGDWFYFAGIWRPAMEEWPEAYAALTIPPSPDVRSYHDRQMAVIRRADRVLRLEHAVPEEELLQPLPGGALEAMHPIARRGQANLTSPSGDIRYRCGRLKSRAK
jgi:putative SOS response-associated peptidase YedK